jgi:sortase A
MKHASRWLRGIELALWVVGLSLLGIALESTLARWTYQAQQERALFERGPAVSAGTRQREIATGLSVNAEADAFASEAIARAVHATDSDHDVVPPIKPQQVRTRVQASAAEQGALGRLEIPRLGVFAIVTNGTDEATLARAVGRVPGSALPGERGNMVLAGHRDTFFRPLRDIEVNDRIRIVVPPETYEYRVRSMRIVEPEETNVLASNGSEELTLVTCYPFRFVGPAPERFVVTATRVN